MYNKTDFVNPEKDLNYAYELWRNVCSYHGPGGDFRYCEHLGECCTCFGGGLWDLEGWDADGLPIFGEMRSYIPDYEENRAIYAEDPTQEEWDERDDDFVPLTRTKRKDLPDSSRTKRQDREVRAKKLAPRHTDAPKTVQSPMEGDLAELDLSLPKKITHREQKKSVPWWWWDEVDADESYRRIRRKDYWKGDCYWRKHNAGAFPRYTFFLSSRFERNFKVELQKERLRVQTQKALWWHRLILDYFPHFLPEHVQETHFSNVRYRISQCEKEVEKLLSVDPDTLYPQFACSTRRRHRWEADLEHARWKISYWTEKLRYTSVYAA